MLAIVETHPIQYHAPIWRYLQEVLQLPVVAIYGSDFSVVGGVDKEFGRTVAWDVDLLSGYRSVFLSRVQTGGAENVNQVRTTGLSRVLNEVKPKAVMIGGYSPVFHQISLISAFLFGRPIMFRGETNDQTRKRNCFKAFGRSLILRCLYRRFAAFLYVGEKSREHYEKHGCKNEKLFFSPYTIDTRPLLSAMEKNSGKDRVDLRRELGLSPLKRIVLFVGKLYSAKGPGVLVDAIKASPTKRLAETQVVFVGDGNMREQLKEAALSSPAIDAVFIGFKNQSELGPYYQAADLFVLPSFSETWGLVVNEALFHGVPCVVTDRVGCGADLIRPGITGFVCQSQSVPALAQAIEQSICLIGREDITKACRAMASKYSIELAAKGIYEAYHSCVNDDY